MNQFTAPPPRISPAISGGGSTPQAGGLAAQASAANTSIIGPPNTFTLNWYGWFSNLASKLNLIFKNALGTTAAPITVPLAKLTGGGSAGHITFVNGIATAYTAPT